MRILGVLVGTVALGTTAALAEAPLLQTPSPVIYLAENLDEVDQLGWCIDTLGRGFSEQLQVHSCKPQGGDVQFSHDAETGQIQSVAFASKCATWDRPDDEAVPFSLLDCDGDRADQKFAFNAQLGQFHPEGQDGLCLAAGAASRTAGPFMSRDLVVADCATTDASLTTWVVAP